MGLTFMTLELSREQGTSRLLSWAEKLYHHDQPSWCLIILRPHAFFTFPVTVPSYYFSFDFVFISISLPFLLLFFFLNFFPYYCCAGGTL
jgi:hypothetical protein